MQLHAVGSIFLTSAYLPSPSPRRPERARLTHSVPHLKAFRSNHDIPVYRDGEMRERNEMKLEEAAEYLSVDEKTVRRLIRSGAITARQACKGAPWVIDATVLPKRVQDFPPAQKPRQENLCFQ